MPYLIQQWRHVVPGVTLARMELVVDCSMPLVMLLTMCLIPCLTFYAGGNSGLRVRTRGKRRRGNSVRVNDRAYKELMRQEKIRNLRICASLISYRQRERVACSHLHRRRWPRHWRARRRPGHSLKQNSGRVPCGVGQRRIVKQDVRQRVEVPVSFSRLCQSARCRVRDALSCV